MREDNDYILIQEGINRGAYSLKEVEDYLGGMRLVEKTIDDEELNLKHPKTGASLKACKGYYNAYYSQTNTGENSDNAFKGWHYIEYEDSRGMLHNYVSRNGNDIGKQNMREISAEMENSGLDSHKSISSHSDETHHVENRRVRYIDSVDGLSRQSSASAEIKRNNFSSFMSGKSDSVDSQTNQFVCNTHKEERHI